MRVLLAVEQLRRPLPGGIGRYAAGLLAGLAALAAEEGDGPALELLASRPPRQAAAGGSGDPLARWGLPVRASRLPGPALTRAWDRGLVAAPRGYDVVHSVSLAVPPVHRGRGRRGSALVVAVHDTAWRSFPESTTTRGRRWHEAALRRALARADAFVTPAETVAATLRELGAGPGAVDVLPFGADHLPPPDEDGADALLARLGAPGPFLLSAGTLEPRKNLRRLFQAYAEARPSLPEPWPLVVVGPRGWGDAGIGPGGPGGPGAPGHATDGVLAAGAVTDGVLAALYRRARAFAYVPLTEGYGLPPLEAMGAGVPVVASTGVPSVVPPSGEAAAALLVGPSSVEGIAAALVRAATDEPLRRDLVARGHALYAERTWRRCARGHLALWGRVA